MTIEKILFVTQTLGHKEACGIGLIGRLLGETLVKSKKYSFEILYTDSEKELENKIIEISPKVIIYNYHPHTTPWVHKQTLRNRFSTIIHIMLHHDVHQQMIDSYIPSKHFGFKYIVSADPCLKGNDHVFLVNRLIPPYQPKPYVDRDIPVIGFQGFGPRHKSFHKIAEKVQEEFEEAIIRLHIPFSFYRDPMGNEAKNRVAEVMSIIKKPGIKVEASHDLLSTQQLIEFLSQNTINCYFYDALPNTGLASSPDYALAARRPIAVTKSHQLRNFIELRPSICIEENSLKNIISLGTAPLEVLYNSYAEENVLNDYEKTIDYIIKNHKPSLAIVSSHNTNCAYAHYTDALKDFLHPIFNVEIIDLKTSQLLRQEGENYQKMSKTHIDQICIRLQEFDLVNVHLELGLYGASTESILSRILRICQASGRLILAVHTIDYKGAQNGHSHVYQQIMQALKRRPSSNPFHLITYLPQDSTLIKKMHAIDDVTDFPLFFLTNERRKKIQQSRNPNVWKKQFGFKKEDITIGMFGLLSAHKNYLHALRTLNLLPAHYKLLIVGEAHHMNIKEWKVDPVIQEMVSYLDDHPALVGRVIFTGRRDDAKYFEDLANIDFLLLPSFEVGQSGSATLSTGLELSCAILKSNTSNTSGYEAYFSNCFETFDIGNYYETKHKILNFDKTKLLNLNKKLESFSEVQLRQIYMDIYELMKETIPIQLSWQPPKTLPVSIHPTRSLPARMILKVLPKPVKSILTSVLGFLRRS